MPINGISGSSGVSPTYGTNPAGGSNATSASDPAALPAPSTQLVPVSDLGAQLAALLVKSGQAAHDADQKARAADEKQEDDAEQAQVTALHQEASNMRAEGWVTGLATIGEGAMTFASTAADANTKPGAHSPTSVGVYKGLGLGSKGAGDIGGALFKAAQKNDDANATAAAATASHAKRAADDDNDNMKSDRDLINAAVDFYKQYADTKSQERSAIVHGA